MSPHELSLCITLGLLCGVFPMLGTTTLLCFLIALVFKLNQPVIQMINYVVYPFQLLLIIPFFQIGSWLFGESFTLSFSDVYEQFTTDGLGMLKTLWRAQLRAIGIWLFVVALLGFPLYFIVKNVVRKLSKAK